MKNLLLVFAVLALTLNFTSCKKDAIDRTHMLVGEWSHYSIDENIIGEESQTSYIIKEDFNVDFCEASFGIQICYSGNWQWSDEDQTTVVFKSLMFGKMIEQTIEIKTLTEDILTGRLTNEGESHEVEFRKFD